LTVVQPLAILRWITVSSGFFSVGNHVANVVKARGIFASDREAHVSERLLQWSEYWRATTS